MQLLQRAERETREGVLVQIGDRHTECAGDGRQLVHFIQEESRVYTLVRENMGETAYSLCAFWQQLGIRGFRVLRAGKFIEVIPNIFVLALVDEREDMYHFVMYHLVI